MRLAGLLVALPLLAGISVAQDTNFAAGPQYLVTSGSPMFLRPIATPSLSLGEAPPTTTANAIETPSEGTLPPRAPSNAFLSDVYWGGHKPDEIGARRMETPSVTPDQTASYMNAVANQNAAPAIAEATPEIPAVSNVVAITSAQLPSNLPAILDVGATGTADPQSLLIHGYGLSLGEVAAYWQSHKRIAPHVFTNADVVRRPQ